MQFKPIHAPEAAPSSGWQSQAACKSEDPELFFGPEAEGARAKRAREAAAVAVCSCCPVQAHCRAWALAALTPYGVWGGLPESERLAERTHAAGVAS